MTIHVVQTGDNISKIAAQYGVTTEQLIQDNELKTPESLVIGQTIVVLYPDRTYTVKQGDTLLSIANQYNTTVIELLQNNPELSQVKTLAEGQKIVIDYKGEKLGDIAINGYAFPEINQDLLIRTLPYLTYLTIFTYGFTPAGELLPLNDEEVIRIARDYGVAPLMLISTLTKEGTFSNALAHSIFVDKEAQNRLIDNIISNMKKKNYYGLDIDFEFVYPEDRQAYVDFVKNVTTKLNAEGYQVMVALAPKIASDQPGLVYEGHDYAGLGAAANAALLMTYEWGYTYGPPMAVSPLNEVKKVLDYGVTQIPPEKLFMGVPNYAYDWTLPYVKGKSRAKSIGNVEAVELALKENIPIKFDETAQTPFYNYTADDGKEHVVWFEDARSINAKVGLVPQYKLQGVAYWNLMKYFPQNWLVVNSLFDINKLL